MIKLHCLRLFLSVYLPTSSLPIPLALLFLPSFLTWVWILNFLLHTESRLQRHRGDPVPTPGIHLLMGQSKLWLHLSALISSAVKKAVGEQTGFPTLFLDLWAISLTCPDLFFHPTFHKPLNWISILMKYSFLILDFWTRAFRFNPQGPSLPAWYCFQLRAQRCFTEGCVASVN